jgi:hypothetical protein
LGAVVSPLLANVFLHYVLDLWVNQWRSRNARGDVVIVRYADDFVLRGREGRSSTAMKPNGSSSSCASDWRSSASIFTPRRRD